MKKNISITALFEAFWVRYSFIYFRSWQTAEDCLLKYLQRKHFTRLNACTLKWTLSCVSSEKQRKLGRGNTLADGQDSDSFHICFKKIDIWEKRGEDIKRTNIILFQWSSLTPENGLSILNSKCVVPKLNSFHPRSCLRLWGNTQWWSELGGKC